MNKNNAKALSTLLQRIQKHTKILSPVLQIISRTRTVCRWRCSEERIQRLFRGEWRRNQCCSFLEEETKSTFWRESKFLKKKKKRWRIKRTQEDEGWDTDSTSSDSEEEEEGKQTMLASRFLKMVLATEEDKKATEKKWEDKTKKQHDRKSKHLDEEEDSEGGEWERVWGGVSSLRRNQKCLPEELRSFIYTVVIKKLNEILQAQGKKGTDCATPIELLQLLVQIASENNLGEDVIIKIKFSLWLQPQPGHIHEAWTASVSWWTSCLQNLTFLLKRTFWKRVRSYIMLTSHCMFMAIS